VNSTHKPANRVLVIACGNPLRSDDGVAWLAAEQLRQTLQPPAKVICVHQLTPELAEEASRAEIVFFIDATRIGDRAKSYARPSLRTPQRCVFLTTSRRLRCLRFASSCMAPNRVDFLFRSAANVLITEMVSPQRQ
jgi:hypothetical protein